VRQQRFPSDLVQNFGMFGFEPRPLAGGHNRNSNTRNAMRGIGLGLWHPNQYTASQYRRGVFARAGAGENSRPDSRSLVEHASSLDRTGDDVRTYMDSFMTAGASKLTAHPIAPAPPTRSRRGQSERWHVEPLRLHQDNHRARGGPLASQ
jgi:hypothetical protein